MSDTVERCWLCHKILLTPALKAAVRYEEVCHCSEPETTSLEERLDALEDQIGEIKNLIVQRDAELATTKVKGAK